ncbi:hypothetical protein BG011_007510 [Mortierella polycephala]|uniref:Uncharacterized protein n=1 Tax=Mortierella polycephala TaxID=41804 RepID=A0A9P6TXM0_9FUNG|nr:hypothetical protein BG011_007510 [Mortierella polycephala]
MVYLTYGAEEAEVPTFNGNSPSDWASVKFAHDPETRSLDDFTGDLKFIKEMVGKAYHAYANERDQWIEENQDDILVIEAKTILEAKLVKWNRYRKGIQARDTIDSHQGF